MRTEALPYKTFAVHSQSTRPGSPYDFGMPEEQAYDSRALVLPNLAGVSLSRPLEPAYTNYLTNVLGVNIPSVFVPETSGNFLSRRLMADAKTIGKIKDRQQDLGLPFALSVFDVTNDERKLLDHLEREIQVFPEVNFDQAVLLGNKSGFRKFCAETGIPQFIGGTFSSLDDLKTFLADHPLTVVKHPVGTGGDGLSFITPATPATDEDFSTWQQWMEEGEIVAEVFNPGGNEYALHVYIDPVTKKGGISGIYNQLAKKEGGTMSHYGVIYPIVDSSTKKMLQTVCEKQIIPALVAAGYTGPAAIDVIKDDTLSQPLHIMELNARAGANMYLHRMAEQVGESIYANPDVAFMSLVSLPHEITSFAEFSEKFAEVLKPKDNGTLIFTNPGRHEFGYYDITAISPYGAEEAQKVLFNGISQIWGPDKAQKFFAKIYKRS